MLAVLGALLERVVRKGTLEVETASGSRFTVGDGSGERVAVRFADSRAARQLILRPELALGELYMDGRIILTQGSVYDLLMLLGCNLGFQSPPVIARGYDRLRSALRPLHRRNTARRARRNAAHHYDLDGQLYSLFLDPDMQYSCAYFEHPVHTLEEAQLAKKRHIAAKLLVEAGHRVLDIGSGWGGLARYLAERCGAKVTGITLSEAQLAHSTRSCGRRLSQNTEFRLQDYRAVCGRFDRIVSVGMFEHVGISCYDAFFKKAVELLTDDGVMLLHSIGRFDGPNTTNPWIAKYIFPGGTVPALSEVLPAIERAGLIVTDIEILRLHYAETLKAWRERFLARRDEAKALYDERFCRMWEFYLASAECGFRHGGLMVYQVQLAKRLETVPLTRDYIGAREASLRAQEGWQPDQMVAAE
jgi:cyclopropane-fatty-acyl-phospholipid synthase